MEIEIIDNSAKVKEKMEAAVLRALEKCGLVAEGYAKKLAPSPGKAGTGLLRNSITHAISGEAPAISSYKADKGEGSGTYSGTAPEDSAMSVYIGTNVEYAAYLELGTGIYYSGGRQTPWVYQDAKGQWHLTHGQRAQPYLKPAVADHAQQYQDIIKQELKNG